MSFLRVEIECFCITLTKGKSKEANKEKQIEVADIFFPYNANKSIPTRLHSLEPLKDDPVKYLSPLSYHLGKD